MHSIGAWNGISHIQQKPSCRESRSWGRYACWPLSCPMTPVVLPNVASASPHPGQVCQSATAPSNPASFFGPPWLLWVSPSFAYQWNAWPQMTAGFTHRKERGPRGPGEASNKIRLIIWWSFFFKIRWVETHWWLPKAGGKAPRHPEKKNTNSYLSSPSAWLHLDPKPCQNRLPKTRLPYRFDCCLHFCSSSLRLLTRKSIRHASMSDSNQQSIFLGTLSTYSKCPTLWLPLQESQLHESKRAMQKESWEFTFPPTSTMAKAVLRLPGL